MHLVVGLGNPGPEYADNRHNVGFMVADELARRGRAGAPRAKFGAEIAEATISGHRILLCKPQEYMNVSGQAVARVAGFWKVPVSDTIVVHDELDLPYERMKLGAGGGPGGHNGIKSMISALGDPGFARVRVGIGRGFWAAVGCDDRSSPPRFHPATSAVGTRNALPPAGAPAPTPAAARG